MTGQVTTIPRRTGNETFRDGSDDTPFTLLDYWQWAHSNLLTNTQRGVLAEYLVGRALGLTESPREEWAPVDFITSTGLKIEVKSSSYIQAWHQQRHSRCAFTIKETRGWSSATNTFDSEVKRQADVYVFCLLKHLEKSTVDPMNLEQWEFYVVASSDLSLAKSKSIGLQSVRKLAKSIGFHEIRDAVATIETRLLK
jgi:hypothetical protein